MGLFHILIIWSKSIDKKDFIIKDIKTRFEIRKIFNVHWDNNFFIENLKSFYAHSQKHLNGADYEKLLQNKKNTCGDGDFIAIVFKDDNPKFEKRTTNSGVSLVNVNVYDKKIEYRELSNEKYCIHASNDEWETNKDLTILFGLNILDFCKKYPIEDDTIESYCSNVIGVGGFHNITQLFYLLNNTIQYCVLRNFECLPSEYTVEGHGDIDLLVENKNYISYLTQAIPVFKENYRVYHTIKINGIDVPFDFRHIGDNYYDFVWEKNILKTRKQRDCFYIPNDENLYYTLLYHAYVQKPIVKQDYLPKLKQYAKQINKDFVNNVSVVINDLDIYLDQYGYEYIKPTDKSVYYNVKNLDYSSYANRYGSFVCRNEVIVDGNAYITKVYKKETSFVKKGSSHIINNEYVFLKILDENEHFPHVIDYNDINENEYYIEISSFEGESFNDFFNKLRNQRFSIIMMFVKQMFSILCTLKDNGILHRDINPNNIIIDKRKKGYMIGVIDFGWATDVINKNDCLTPVGLGTRRGVPYRPKEGYSDFYSMGVILERFWGHWPYIRKISNSLKGILSEDYENNDVLNAKLAQVEKCIYRNHIGIVDVRRELGVYYRGLKSIVRRKLL